MQENVHIWRYGIEENKTAASEERVWQLIYRETKTDIHFQYFYFF